MKVTIRCPRPHCGGRVVVQPFIAHQGIIDGYEAKCLACARDFTDQLKRPQKRSAA